MNGGKLPEGWVVTQLGNIIELKYGKSLAAQTRDGFGFPVYGSNGVVGKHSIPLINKSGLIVGRKGSYGVVNKSVGPFFPIDTTYYIDDFYNQPLDFLFYYLSFLPLTKLNRSTAIPGLNRDDAYGLNIALPPLAEQKIIAEKLDTLLAQVDSTKARLEQIPQILKRFRQATLTVAIQGDLTKNWRIENNIINAWTNQKASDLCIKVQSGSTPTGNPFEQNGKIPFLKVYNIVNQKIDFDYKPQFITDEVHRSKSKRSIAFPDDILMNIVGPPLGKIAILTDQYPEWNLNQAITLFRVDKEKLLSKFLYYVLCEGKLVRDVMHETKGIVGQINISLTQCREAIIPCPSLLEQHEIVRRVEQLFAYADTVEKQVNNALTRVNNLTQSILAKAFRGELTAQWRAENPDLISGENSAAALLEKIKAERAASGGKKTSRKKA